MSPTTAPGPITTPEVLEGRGSFVQHWQLIGEPGTDHDRFTIVVVGDGYTGSDEDRSRFEARITELEQHLQATPPFDDPDVLGRLNVHVIRTEVEGPGGIPGGWLEQLAPYANEHVPHRPDQDGAPDLLGPRPTLFGTHYSTDRATMSWESRIVIDALDGAQLSSPQGATLAYDAVLIVANSWRLGGTRSGEITAAAQFQFAPVAMHELGHVLGLADEYGAIWKDPRAKPWERLRGSPAPNVDYSRPRRYQAALVPWKGQVRAYQLQVRGSYDWRRTIRVENPDTTCETPDSRTTIPGIDDAAVGLFETAGLRRCWGWRAQLNCEMRIAGSGFCVVCHQALLERLAPYGASDE